MRRVDISRRSALTGLAATALPFATTALPFAAAAQAPTWRDIAIAAKPIARFSKSSAETTFGNLRFLGGIVLSSAERAFGGLSGLVVAPDGGALLAVSDEGTWVTARLVVDGLRPVALEGARIGSLLGADGAAYKGKGDKDCEAIALLDGSLQSGTVLIAFERNHRIERFPVKDRVLQPSAGALVMPREATRMDANAGFEAVSVMAAGAFKGSVVAFSERFLDADGNHTGWLWIDGVPQRLGLAALGGFDITDVAAMPDGGLLVLERRYRWIEGVKMQLRLIPPEEIAPGRVAVGRTLLTADSNTEIDNMEGISTHREPDGTVVVTLVSDDNFSTAWQRTLLMRFALSV